MTTAANGTWRAKLPPGPSRIVEAVYAALRRPRERLGAGARGRAGEGEAAQQSRPPRVAWGGTVRITGQLRRRLPAGRRGAGAAADRAGSTYQTYGVQEHVTGNGRFSTTYTFGAGQASSFQRFWFQLSSLPMGSYPFSPERLGAAVVLVGGHPQRPAPPAAHSIIDEAAPSGQAVSWPSRGSDVGDDESPRAGRERTRTGGRAGAAPATSSRRSPARVGARISRGRLAAFATRSQGVRSPCRFLRGGGPAGRALPATPRAWLEAFSADVATGRRRRMLAVAFAGVHSELEREVHSPAPATTRRAGSVGAGSADP